MRKQAILRIIRKHCFEECCVKDIKSWRECNVEKCLLKPFRFGKDPYPSIKKQEQARKFLHRKAQKGKTEPSSERQEEK